jgi:hypothetical protein
MNECVALIIDPNTAIIAVGGLFVLFLFAFVGMIVTRR